MKEVRPIDFAEAFNERPDSNTDEYNRQNCEDQYYYDYNFYAMEDWYLHEIDDHFQVCNRIRTVQKWKVIFTFLLLLTGQISYLI